MCLRWDGDTFTENIINLYFSFIHVLTFIPETESLQTKTLLAPRGSIVQPRCLRPQCLGLVCHRT